MFKVNREKTSEGYIIRGNVRCDVCGGRFEVVEGKNATVIVDTIDIVNGTEKKMNLTAVAKCNLCEYTCKYGVFLNLNN